MAGKRRMTAEEYLEFERAAEFRHEFYKGLMWPAGEPPQGPDSVEKHIDILDNSLAASHGAGARR